MILALARANASLTNKGERPRVYDPARFNKRETKRLGGNIRNYCTTSYRIVEQDSHLLTENCKSKLDLTFKLSSSMPLPTQILTLHLTFQFLNILLRKK